MNYELNKNNIIYKHFEGAYMPYSKAYDGCCYGDFILFFGRKNELKSQIDRCKILAKGFNRTILRNMCLKCLKPLQFIWGIGK